MTDTDGMDQCPQCGNDPRSKEHFPPNQGSNRTDDHVIRYFHADGMEFCSRSVSTDAETQT